MSQSSWREGEARRTASWFTGIYGQNATLYPPDTSIAMLSSVIPDTPARQHHASNSLVIVTSRAANPSALHRFFANK